MTATLRKSGSFVALTWVGKIPDPHDPEFATALATQRFRSIETAASEEVSAGWVTPADPTGDAFDLEDLDAGNGTWMRVRIDTKKLPKERLDQHIAVAEKFRGKRLTKRERREMRDDLHEKLLPRILPSTVNLDALLFSEKRLVLLFSTSKPARETFAKLWYDSFGAVLDGLGGRALALRDCAAESHQAIEKLEATRWPVAKGGAS